MMIDGRPIQVVGVLPETFRFPDQKPSLVLPMQRDRSKVYLGNFSFQAIARLKPGVSVAQASADIAAHDSDCAR